MKNKQIILSLKKRKGYAVHKMQLDFKDRL